MEQKEAKRSKLPKTDIVCKHFLDAIRKRVYGYKWQCPNGDECHYKHCLPKDYVIKSLKSDQQEDMTFEEFQDLEEKIDAEREKLAENGTKLNEKLFKEWVEKRRKEKEKTTDEKKLDLIKKLKTGRELFSSNKDDFKDDENADEDKYDNEFNALEEETKNIQEQLWTNNVESKNDETVKIDENLFKDGDVNDLDDIDLNEDNCQIEEKKNEADEEDNQEEQEND